MDGENKETLDPQVEQTPIDDWAAAFAALDQKDEEDSEADVGGDEQVPTGNDTTESDGGDSAAEDEAGDSQLSEDVPGGSSDLGGTDGGANEDLDWIGVDLTEEQIGQYRKSFEEQIRNRAISEVANTYIQRGARHTNGRLGATINDPDVCKRDSDGVPRFYNPETGREFTGDNPRRQAQEWVDDYNRELAEAFNKTCQGYEQQLLKQEGGRIAIIEFAPKYKALDPVRRSMFESIIEDYEVTDNEGNIVAYSCDLDKALAAVNRQVKVIQDRFAKKPAAPAAPSGPALDTPSSGGGGTQGNAKPQFKSLEEAMEWEQDQIIARKKGSKR